MPVVIPEAAKRLSGIHFLIPVESKTDCKARPWTLPVGPAFGRSNLFQTNLSGLRRYDERFKVARPIQRRTLSAFQKLQRRGAVDGFCAMRSTVIGRVPEPRVPQVGLIPELVPGKPNSRCRELGFPRIASVSTNLQKRSGARLQSCAKISRIAESFRL
jgi:hypothetical protein